MNKPVSPFGAPREIIEVKPEKEIKVRVRKVKEVKEDLVMNPEVIEKNRQTRPESDAEVVSRLKKKRKEYEELKKIFE